MSPQKRKPSDSPASTATLAKNASATSVGQAIARIDAWCVATASPPSSDSPIFSGRRCGRRLRSRAGKSCSGLEGQLAEGLVAHVSVVIDAPRATVWHALIDREMLERYMYMGSITSDWREGSPILWKSEWQGKSLEVRGAVLRVDPQRALEYSYSRPIFPSARRVQAPSSYYRVAIELFDDGEGTRIELTQHNNTTRKELEHPEGSWRLTLGNLRWLLEGDRSGRS